MTKSAKRDCNNALAFDLIKKKIHESHVHNHIIYFTTQNSLVG